MSKAKQRFLKTILAAGGGLLLAGLAHPLISAPDVPTRSTLETVHGAVPAPDKETPATGDKQAQPPAADAMPVLVPHRALYNVRLSGAKNGAKLSDLEGRMFFVWSDDCQAWDVEQKSQLRFYYAEGEVSDSTTTLTARESKDGTSYDFSVRKKTDDKPVEDARGHASLTATTDGPGTGEAKYSGEKGRVVALENAMFPARHTLELLRQARAGKKFFAINVFDGAEDDGLSEISAFIGGAPLPTEAPVAPAKASLDKVKLDRKDAAKDVAKDAEKGTPELATVPPLNPADPLLTVHAWPIRMAFFKPDNQTGSPEYEMNMVLLDNGIIRSMSVDYDDFTMSADLVKVQALPTAKCQPGS